MKLVAPKERLVEAFSLVQTIVPAKSTRPVLQNIKISVQRGKVELFGTDAEISLRYFLEPNLVEGSGETLLPADKIGSILREIEPGDITLNIEGTDTAVIGPTSYFKLKGMETEEYPQIPAFEDKDAISLKASDLLYMLKRTAFATAKEQSRYALNGVYLLLSNNKVEAVGTDGRRLALVSKKMEGFKMSADKIAIIHTKATSLMERLFSSLPGEVRVNIGENQISVKTPQAELISRLVEGRFPKYQEVVPTDLDKEAVVKKEDMLTGLRRAALLTSEERRSVRFEFGPNLITMISSNPEVGESTVKIPAEYHGAETYVAFNPQFIAEAVKNMDEANIRFKVKDAERPGMLLEGDSYTYVIMPVKSRDF
jgi:DNA polymerase-3 subunit beta